MGKFYRDSIQAFNDAVYYGYFTDKDKGSQRYAGKHMYMYSTTDGGRFRDHFKNIDTRRYVSFISQPDHKVGV